MFTWSPEHHPQMFTGSLTTVQGCSPLNIIHRCSLTLVTVCSVDSQKRIAAAFQPKHASTTPVKHVTYESTHNSDYATNRSKLISSTVVDVRLALCSGETTPPQKTQITFFHRHFSRKITPPSLCLLFARRRQIMRLEIWGRGWGVGEK